MIVDSPIHARSFGLLPEIAGADVLEATLARFEMLHRHPSMEYIQLFKNNGPGSGASLEHPHSQLLALPLVPNQVQIEWNRARGASPGCVFCEMLEAADRDARIIEANADAVVFAPFAPRFAFETWVLPRAHASHFERSDPRAIRAVGRTLHRTLRRLETLLDDPPYNFLLHTAPLHEAPATFYHWHIEILPRLGGIGGYEFGTGCYINTVAPEEAAALMRNT